MVPSSVDLLNAAAPAGLSEKETLKPLQGKNTSFYGRKYKTLWVGANFSFSIILSIFYQAISSGSRYANLKAANHRYHERSTYLWNRSWNRLYAYLEYGGQVINFSANSSGKVKELFDEKVREIDLLNKIYGDPFERMRSDASTVEIPIDKNKLSRLPMNDGICLGASLDFVSRFLKLNCPDDKWFENIETLSQLYTDGGTPEAQITQILYNAQNTREVNKELRGKVNTILNDMRNQLCKYRSDYNKARETVKSKNHVPKSASQEIAALIKYHKRQKARKVYNDLKEKFESYIRETLMQIYNCSARYDLKRFEPLARALGIKLELTQVLLDNRLRADLPTPEFLKESIDQLSPGAYLVETRSYDDDCGCHAMVYIKESRDRGYLFDPNYATVVLQSQKEQADRLWQLTKDSYNKKGTCMINLFHCSLA